MAATIYGIIGMVPLWHGTTMARYLSQHYGMVPLLTPYGMFGSTIRKMVSTLWYPSMPYSSTGKTVAL